MTRTMHFLAKVAFPALYQILFTYLLLIASSASPEHHLPLLALAAAGVPLTARFNLQSLERACEDKIMLVLSPLLNTLLLPCAQLLTLAVALGRPLHGA